MLAFACTTCFLIWYHHFLSLPACWLLDFTGLQLANKFIILATTIQDFKTSFWISWSLRSTDFVLWEVFLQISGLTKVFSKFLNFRGGNVCITTFSSFSFLKTPHRRSYKLFSSFLWMGDPLSSWHSNSWVKSCNISSSSSLLSPFFIEF